MIPIISVIIPLYNKEQDLPRCMESILSYTKHPIEIIIVDDDSTDKSWNLAQNYSQQDPRVRALKHQHNKGTYATRETGIRASSGQYIFCIDPDDWINNKSFDAAMPYIRKNIDIIVTECVFLYPDHKTYYKHEDKFLKNEEILNSYTSLRISLWNMIPKFIKTELALKALNELNINRYLIMSEDLLLFLTICIFAKTWCSINISAYYYWIKGESSATTGKKKLDEMLQYIEQTKYILCCLEKVFEKYGHTADQLIPIKMALFNFYRDQMERSELDEASQTIMIKHMFDCIGILNAYKSMLTYGVNTDFTGSIRMLNQLLPVGSIRRKIIKKITKKIWSLYRFFKSFKN